MKALVEWRCPCGAVLHLLPCRVKDRVVCCKTCPAKRRPGGIVCQQRRLKRVMLAYGYTEGEARAFLQGWRKGRLATTVAFQRKRKAKIRVGDQRWEAAA